MLFLTLMLLTSCGLSIDKKGLNNIMKNEIKFDQLVKDLVTLEGSEFSEQAKKSLDLWIDAAIDFSNMAIELIKDHEEAKKSDHQKIITHPYVKISYAIEEKLEDINGKGAKDSEFRYSFKNINKNKWAQGLLPPSEIFKSPTAHLIEQLDKMVVLWPPARIVTPLFAYILCLCKHNVNIKFLDVFKLEHLAEQELKLKQADWEFGKRQKKKEISEMEQGSEKELEEKDFNMEDAMSNVVFGVYDKFSMERIIIQIIKDYQGGKKGNKIGEKVVPSFTAETKQLVSDATRKAKMSQNDADKAIEKLTWDFNHMAELVKELVQFLIKQEEKKEFNKSR